MEIKRDVYLEKFKPREHNGLIKVVTGIRRCGKSYLLFNLFHNWGYSNSGFNPYCSSEAEYSEIL